MTHDHYAKNDKEGIREESMPSLKTYGEVCQDIADVFNQGKCEVKFTGDDIFTLHPDGELYFLPYLQEVAEQGVEMLDGLLLTDPFFAKMFVFKIEEKKRNG